MMRLSKLLISGILCLALLLSQSQAMALQTVTTRCDLDLVIALDNSLSLEERDPNNLRQRVLRFVSSYLGIATNQTDYHIQASLISFADAAQTVIPSKPIEQWTPADLANIPTTTEGDKTDFIAALEGANQILEENDSLNQRGCDPVILLVSDAGLDRNPALILDTAYAEEIRPVVQRLREASISIQLLAINPQPIHQNLWEEIIEKGNVQVTDSTLSFGLYESILAKLLPQRIRQQLPLQRVEGASDIPLSVADFRSAANVTFLLDEEVTIEQLDPAWTEIENAALNNIHQFELTDQPTQLNSFRLAGTGYYILQENYQSATIDIVLSKSEYVGDGLLIQVRLRSRPFAPLTGITQPNDGTVLDERFEVLASVVGSDTESTKLDYQDGIYSFSFAEEDLSDTYPFSLQIEATPPIENVSIRPMILDIDSPPPPTTLPELRLTHQPQEQILPREAITFTVDIFSLAADANLQIMPLTITNAAGEVQELMASDESSREAVVYYMAEGLSMAGEYQAEVNYPFIGSSNTEEIVSNELAFIVQAFSLPQITLSSLPEQPMVGEPVEFRATITNLSNETELQPQSLNIIQNDEPISLAPIEPIQRGTDFFYDFPNGLMSSGEYQIEGTYSILLPDGSQQTITSKSLLLTVQPLNEQQSGGGQTILAIVITALIVGVLGYFVYKQQKVAWRERLPKQLLEIEKAKKSKASAIQAIDSDDLQEAKKYVHSTTDSFVAAIDLTEVEAEETIEELYEKFFIYLQDKEERQEEYKEELMKLAKRPERFVIKALAKALLQTPVWKEEPEQALIELYEVLSNGGNKQLISAIAEAEIDQAPSHLPISNLCRALDLVTYSPESSNLLSVIIALIAFGETGRNQAVIYQSMLLLARHKPLRGNFSLEPNIDKAPDSLVQLVREINKRRPFRSIEADSARNGNSERDILKDLRSTEEWLSEQESNNIPELFWFKRQIELWKWMANKSLYGNRELKNRILNQGEELLPLVSAIRPFLDLQYQEETKLSSQENTIRIQLPILIYNLNSDDTKINAVEISLEPYGRTRHYPKIEQTKLPIEVKIDSGAFKIIPLPFETYRHFGFTVLIEPSPKVKVEWLGEDRFWSIPERRSSNSEEGDVTEFQTIEKKRWDEVIPYQERTKFLINQTQDILLNTYQSEEDIGCILKLRGLSGSGKTTMLDLIRTEIIKDLRSKDYCLYPVQIDFEKWSPENTLKLSSWLLDIIFQQLSSQDAFTVYQRYGLDSEDLGIEKLTRQTWSFLQDQVITPLAQKNIYILFLIDGMHIFKSTNTQQLNDIGHKLKNLVRYEKASLIITHDYLNLSWENDFYKSHVPGISSSYRELYLEPFDLNEFSDFFGDLVEEYFTRIAVLTIWHFSGGQPALVRSLIDSLLAKAISNREIIVGEDIKYEVLDSLDLIADTEDFVLDRLRQRSLTQLEQHILQTFVDRDFVDLKKSQIIHLSRDHEGNWYGIETLVACIRYDFNKLYQDVSIQEIETSLETLIKKSVLGIDLADVKVTINDEKYEIKDIVGSQSISWKIGWLYHYFKKSSRRREQS